MEAADSATISDTLLDVPAPEAVIRTTPNHPFYVRGKGFVLAKNLVVSDEFRTHDRCCVALTAKSDPDTVEPVYNLQVEDCHTYFVRFPGSAICVLVHNDSEMAPLRKRPVLEIGEDKVTRLVIQWGAIKTPKPFAITKDNAVDYEIAKEKDYFDFRSQSADEFFNGLKDVIGGLPSDCFKNGKLKWPLLLRRSGHASAGLGGAQTFSDYAAHELKLNVTADDKRTKARMEKDLNELAGYFAPGSIIEDYGCFGLSADETIGLCHVEWAMILGKCGGGTLSVEPGLSYGIVKERIRAGYATEGRRTVYVPAGATVKQISDLFGSAANAGKAYLNERTPSDRAQFYRARSAAVEFARSAQNTGSLPNSVVLPGIGTVIIDSSNHIPGIDNGLPGLNYGTNPFGNTPYQPLPGPVTVPNDLVLPNSNQPRQ